MSCTNDFYAQFEISVTIVAQLGKKQISAPSVAEIETEGNQSTSAIVVNSAPMGAELQKYVYDLITSVGWMQNRVILEKCKDFKQIAFYLKQTK